MARNHRFTRLWQSPYVRHVRRVVSPGYAFRCLTARHRRMPDFIIAGAQKSGTTSLYAYLIEHPQVQLPVRKELRFFDNNFQAGENWYRMHFPFKPMGKEATKTLCGESTAYYMCYPHAAKRIAETIPSVKIILLLRNPVDRAFSHYQLNLRRGIEPLSFDDAIAAESMRLEQDRDRMLEDSSYCSFAHEKFSYLARGRYAEQLVRWRSFFGNEQLLVIESSEFFKDTEAVYSEVLKFLGLPEAAPAHFGNRFPGKYKIRMSDVTRERLEDYFLPHNEQLYTMLGRRFRWDCEPQVRSGVVAA